MGPRPQGCAAGGRALGARVCRRPLPKGARNLPPARIKAGDVGFAADDEILVICLSGHRELPHQAKELAAMGYANVANVSGGLLAWQRAGLPVKASRR